LLEVTFNFVRAEGFILPKAGLADFAGRVAAADEAFRDSEFITDILAEEEMFIEVVVVHLSTVAGRI
jgi:hypothetical protein